MSIIETIEESIINTKLTDELFQKFTAQLMKVPKHNRLGHCCRTAIQMPAKRCNDAVKLIEYGLKHYEATWSTLYTSYLYIGMIYEKSGKYKEAYEAYVMARSAVEEHSEYIPNISLDILWTKLHTDSFRYSEDTEKLYKASDSMDSFDKGFIVNEYKLLIAKIVILKEQGKESELNEAVENAFELIKENKSRLKDILLRHGIDDKLNPTTGSMRFLKELKSKRK